MYRDEKKKKKKRIPTMKAPHCSFSARGNSLIVSITCIFVSESIYMDLSLDVLRSIPPSARKKARKKGGKVLHGRKGSMHGSTPNFNSNDRVQQSHRRLKRAQQGIVIRKHSEMARFCSNAHARCDVFFRGPKPRLSLCLISNT